MYVVFLIFIATISIAGELLFKTDSAWEVRKNFLGYDYALVENKSDRNSLLIKKLSNNISPNEAEAYLTKLILDKKEAKLPWTAIEFKETSVLKWGQDSGGILKLITYIKDNENYSSYIGIYSMEKSHYFIYFAEKSYKFRDKKEKIFGILKSVKLL
jgi:hypothetical protein